MFDTLAGLPRSVKKAILLVSDFVLLYFALWASFVIRLEELWPAAISKNLVLLLCAPPLAIPVFMILGLYRAVIRHMAIQFVLTIGKAALSASVILIALTAFTHTSGMPRSVYLIYFFLTLIFVGGTRTLIRITLPALTHKNGNTVRVGLYGAGDAGRQIAKALSDSNEFTAAAFFDDSPEIQQWEILGIKVYRPEQIPEIIAKKRLKEIVLCIPSAPRSRRKEILEFLEPFPVMIRTLPSVADIVAGQVKIEDITEVPIEDLLGRDPVAPNPSLMRAKIEGKAVMVTGAGGSIGSELCRQIVTQKPACLVLFEISEYALYQIDHELRKTTPDLNLVPILGSVNHQARVARVMRAYGVQTVFHAAAYKHVPLVEYNMLEGVYNNVFGTLRTARAALDESVETFILISTDKAVRPTNVMGATKRFSELILQGLAQLDHRTQFTMVRFGNVLGSSGSVIPLFYEQIREGGPVTVTHPEITRFFMTIAEAAQLVIQAGAMGSGGDVFVLDMGQPVKIFELAKKMIRLSGLTVQEKQGDDGDISIVFSGLRPGEKMYEELLIGDHTEPTDHPRIMKAHETALDWAEVEDILAGLLVALKDMDAPNVLDILGRCVAEYTPNGPLVDLIGTTAHH